MIKILILLYGYFKKTIINEIKIFDEKNFTYQEASTAPRTNYMIPFAKKHSDYIKQFGRSEIIE